MKEVDGKKLYTVKEVAYILGVNVKRIKAAEQTRKLIPDDLVPHRGRYAMAYVFSEDTILDYARKTGLNAVFENAALAYKKTADEKRKELAARRTVENEVNPADEGVIITAENVREILGGSEPPTHEQVCGYVVALGKAYVKNDVIGCRTELTPYPWEAAVENFVTAENIAEKYGGRILNLYRGEA